MSIMIHPDADTVAAAAASRLITRLIDIQAGGRIPAVALTGGGVGIGTLRHIASSPAQGAIDWSRFDIYWGDERFVPAADAERNAKQAREALLDHVDVDPERIHAMPASDGEFGGDVDAAAAAYDDVLARRTSPLDIVLLGMGPEGHIASIFPHSPALDASGQVTAVRNCPKPPPTRISLTFRAIRAADEVWLLVAGEAKAQATRQALGGQSERDIPAAGAIGRRHTRWLVDRAAASALPESPHTM